MAIRWWDPFGDLGQMHRNMDRVFEQFFGPGGTSQPTSGDQLPTYYLPLDILETEHAYNLYASVPGFGPEQVEVTFADGLLTVQATAEPVTMQGDWLRRERPYGHWVRRLQLPNEVQADKIEAAFENGVLVVTVPKAERPKPVKIAVGSGKTAIAAKN